ncbi:MAG: hypothetical protein ACLPN5_21450 [Roseiarcus sp.]
MTKLDDARLHVMPSALPPTEQELEAWRALSRDEQAQRYRDALADPDCAIPTDDTMAQILAEARAQVAHPASPR